MPPFDRKTNYRVVGIRHESFEPHTSALFDDPKITIIRVRTAVRAFFLAGDGWPFVGERRVGERCSAV
jgi:hypothetical protein